MRDVDRFVVGMCGYQMIGADMKLAAKREGVNLLPSNLDRWYCVYERETQTIVAVAALRHKHGSKLAHIHGCFTDKAHRGQGFGRKLVLAAFNEALSMGCTQVDALAYDTRLYEHLGFKKVRAFSRGHRVVYTHTAEVSNGTNQAGR